MTQEIKHRIEQIKRGEVPDGYKKTKVGIIPEEWGETRFNKKFSRISRKNMEGNTNVLTISAQYGLINQKEFFNKSVASEDKSTYYLLKKGEYAYNKSYSSGYPFGALKRLERYEEGVVSPLYICFAATEDNKCTDFYSQYFEAGKMNSEIHAFAQEGARNHGLLNIAVNDFFNSIIVSPPLAEQEKIAKILAAQDKVIALKEKLLEEKKKQKKYLMQQLLTGKKCISGFSGVYSSKKMKTIITEISIRNNDGISRNVMSVSNVKGFVSQTEQFDKIVASKDTSNYKIVKYGTFAYNPSRINVGSLALYKGNQEIIVSPMYSTFVIADDVNMDFLLYWFRSFEFSSQLKKYLSGSVRDSLNISDLFLFNIQLPRIEEQNAIAEILSNADKEISLIQKSIDKEKQKKKALMQLLLTGIVRTKLRTK